MSTNNDEVAWLLAQATSEDRVTLVSAGAPDQAASDIPASIAMNAVAADLEASESTLSSTSKIR